ncbi:MAG TPA: hypothetical protein VEL72_07270, partial [Ktedonobacteraceae bacterium]|nr:hypothetical protein [Ktedonobacteraceae bacterium]
MQHLATEAPVIFSNISCGFTSTFDSSFAWASSTHGIRNEIRASKQQRREGPFDPCQDEGKEGKRETKIDHPWQKVSSLG